MTPTMRLAGSTDVPRLLKFTQTLDEHSRASTLSYLAGPVVASTATHFPKTIERPKEIFGNALG